MAACAVGNAGAELCAQRSAQHRARRVNGAARGPHAPRRSGSRGASARAAMASGVQIEHKKGEVNELKASLRNPSLDRVCCCSSARHSSFGGAGARVEVTRSLRRASKIGVLT